MTLPLVGRTRELEELGEKLAGDCRLITITGPPGIGKSRLARELVGQEDELHVAWCEIGNADSESAIADRVAAALGMTVDRDHAPDSVAAVGRALRALGPTRIVLDDVEKARSELAHVLEHWLDAAPEVELVVASRQALGAPGEIVIELGPLAEAGTLFVQRARLARPDYAPNDAELGHVREIVAELDENPLAIELAAPRIAVMGARALLHRLKSRFELLRRGGDRHGSLEAAIDAAYVALEPSEQSALAQASVFAGAFSLEAAEAVLEPPRAALDALQSLRRKSLVSTREIDGEVRLWLSRSIREFARQKLDSAARAELEARHAEHYSNITDRARLVSEKGDALAVAQRVLSMGSVNREQATRALRVLIALEPVLSSGGSLDAYVALVNRVVEATAGSGADPRLMARALLLSGSLRLRQGRAHAGTEDLVRALGAARALDDDAITARAMHALGHALMARGDHDAAREHFERAAELFARCDDRSGEARALASLARVSRETEPRVALALVERARAAHALAGDRLAETEDLRVEIELVLDLGDLGRAETEIGESIRLSESLGDRAGVAQSEVLHAHLHWLAGRLEPARALYSRAASELGRLGLRGAEASALGWLGVLARAEGKLAEAHALLGHAFQVLEEGSDGQLATLFRVQRAALDTDVGAPARELPACDEADAEARLLLDVERSRRGGDLGVALGRARARASASHRLRLALGATEARLSDDRSGPALSDDALVVDRGGQWFRAPKSERVALDRRRPLALMLARLAAERVSSPGHAIGWDVLLEAGWPGERVLAEAAAHRVRVGISTLRKLGLRDLLQTTPGGYRLSADVAFDVV